MIHFMVDYENVGSNGLQGVEYLTAEDSLTIFYSQSCRQIENRRIQHIISSGCTFSLCRLQNAGKNALDFYITSKIGELYGSGYTGMTAIVSKDKGYRAVQEYWRNCVKPGRNIVLRPNIEQCIVSSNENSARRATIQKNLQEVNLETQYKQYKQYEDHLKIKKELEICFADTAYNNLLEQIADIVDGKKGRKVLYLDTLKQFGKKRGLEIYTKIREMV